MVVINECQTRLNTNNLDLWREAGLSIDKNSCILFPGIGMPKVENTIKDNMIPNALVWLSSRLGNFIAAGEGFAPILAGDRSELLQEDELGEYGMSQKSQLEKWKSFARELEVFFEGLPATFQPTTRTKSSWNMTTDLKDPDQANSRTFYEVWYANAMVRCVKHLPLIRDLRGLPYGSPFEVTKKGFPPGGSAC